MDGDQATIVVQQPPEVVEVPVAPTVGETLGAAAAVVEMASTLQQQSAPVDRSGEMIDLLREISSKLDGMQTGVALALATPPVVEVIAPVPETPPVINEPEVTVNTGSGEIEKETIETPIPTGEVEAPKKRKRSWL